MASLADISVSLSEELEKAARQSKARTVAVALLDFETRFRFSHAGDRWFHAASTIKVAVLLAVLRAADEGRLRLEAPLHVRNRFIGAADGLPFRLDSDSDAMPELYRAIGRTVNISDLAEGMIAASSNLATNLLLDLVGVEYARNVLRDALRVLLAQRFKSMIPAGLPAHATVAHKTGEISTACHDMGIVYLPERQPYIAVILTEFDPEHDGRRETVAAISEMLYLSVLGLESKPR